MPETATTATAPARFGLTDRGRVRAILAALESRWDGLTPDQRARAHDLLSELSAAIRQREVRTIGRLPAQTG